MVSGARLTAVLLAAALLAGCSSEPAETTSGQVKKVSGKFTEGQLQGGEGPGDPEQPATLVGHVIDDLNASVAGARVSVLGTTLTDETNETGFFRIEGLDAGTHRIRVDANFYQSLEEKVTVPGGLVTTVEILMLPDARGAGYRPHLHDYWGSETQLVLMDEEFDPRDSPDLGNAYLVTAYHTVQHPNQGDSVWIPTPTSDDLAQPPIVVPGTGSIDVTFTWDPTEVTVPKIGLAYRTAASTTLNSLPGSGSPASWNIPVQANETDNGHQAFTLWEFYLVYENDATASPTTWRPAVVAGPVHITIKLNKDPSGVRFEPGHVDHWGDKTEMPLPIQKDANGNLVMYSANGGTITASHFVFLEDGAIVPPGTTRMSIRFTWDSSSATIPGEKDLRLGWRSADQPPGPSRGAEQYYRSGAVSCGARCLLYDFTLEGGQTDGYYQQKSNWAFFPYPAYEEDDGRPRTYEGGIKLGFEVTVYRDASA